MFRTKLTIVQNFICTHPVRLKMLLDQLPVMGRIFNDINFVVNYNTIDNLPVVETAYKKHIRNLDFSNNTTKDWGITTLELVRKVSTPYVMYLCEDFSFIDDTEQWNNVLLEIFENNIDFVMLAKLECYANPKSSFIENYEEGNYVYFYNSKNSPSKTLSIDAIYKKNFLIERLQEYANLYSHNLPNPYEAYYCFQRGLRTFDLNCAIPKELILYSYHPENQRQASIESIQDGLKHFRSSRRLKDFFESLFQRFIN